MREFSYHLSIGILVCSTNGGNEVNKDCVFPFIYESLQYHACTKTDSKKDWCYTKVDSNGVGIYGKWGYCNSQCKSKS